MADNLEYEELTKLFESEYGTKTDDDEEFLKNAIRIFCIETFRAAGSGQMTHGTKAALVIAQRLMRVPDLRKTFGTSFPSAFFDKAKMRTPAEKRRRAIAFEILTDLEKEGGTLAAAIERVANKRNVSVEKARQSYYENKLLIQLFHDQAEKKSKN